MSKKRATRKSRQNPPKKTEAAAPAPEKPAPAKSKPGNAGLWIWLSLGGLFAVALVFARVIYTPCDDTYIYLIYVKNFLEGDGLTFNGMKVQGFTSVLWTILLALFGWLPFELPSIANGLSVLSGLFVFAATYRFARQMNLTRAQSLVVPALLAATWDFVFYMGNGMEALLLAGLIVMSMQYVMTEDSGQALRSKGLPAVLSLTILARPEGLLVAVIVIAYLGWRSRSAAAVARSFIWMLVWLAPVAVILRLYYGSWLPNTYYAKAGAGLSNMDQGIVYLWNFVKVECLIVAALVWVIVFRSRAMGRAVIPFVILIIVWLANVAIQGGDNMVGFRAFLPIVPIIYLIVIWGARKLQGKWILLGVIIIGAAHIGMYYSNWAKGSSWNCPIKEHAESWRLYMTIRKDVGLYLKKRLPPDSVIALSSAGVIPYYSELKTIDMLGLNNEHIARHGDRDRSQTYGHQAGDGAYVLRSKPSAILFGGIGSSKAVFLSDHQLLAIPEFHDQYSLQRLPYNHCAYFRKDLMHSEEE